jgi:hypothetical protein
MSAHAKLRFFDDGARLSLALRIENEKKGA